MEIPLGRLEELERSGVEEALCDDAPLVQFVSLVTHAFWSRPATMERAAEGSNMGNSAMKRLAIAIGLLAIGFAAATPARADFVVVKFATSG